MVSQQNSNVAQRALWLTLKGAGVKEHSSEKFGDEVENPDKEQKKEKSRNLRPQALFLDAIASLDLWYRSLSVSDH